MDKRITIRDVAESAGCSFVAVSRVLSGRDIRHVSPETRERVRSAAERLGYRPSPAARALRTGRTRTVGLLLGAFYNRMEGCVAHALTEAAKQCGYRLIIALTNYDPEEEREALEDMLNRQTDGVIDTLSLDPESPLALRLRKGGYPILLQDNAQTFFSSAWYDYDTALPEVFAAFRRAGIRHVAMICSLFNGEADHRRALAEENGIELECFTHGDGDHSLEHVYAEIAGKKIPGVFALESMVIRNFLESAALSVPSYRPACVCAYTLPFEHFRYERLLGAVYRPFRELSEQRVDILVRMIESSHTLRRTLRIPCRFTDRNELARIHAEQLRDPYYRYFR